MGLMLFEAIRRAAAGCGRKRIAVAGTDEAAIEALVAARNMGLAELVLVEAGGQESAQRIAGPSGASLDGFRIVAADGVEAAAVEAVRLVRDGEADICMKGSVPTDAFMRAVLDRDRGLRSGRLISHAAVLTSARLKRTFIVTDGGVNIAPSLEEKAEILRNALPLARALGSPRPKVAVMAAVEKPNPKMPATMDAAALAGMAARGEFGECDVGGPLALDNAVSEEDARKKGIEHPVAGRAEILLVPDIHSGNLMAKAIMYFSECEFGGIVMGTRAPVAFLSRADSAATRLNSIALAVLTAGGL
ncbi:MAG: bifunctional enoyl-CoA hydratase/phosphate acetyltransferase [Planctomycetota bacterium]|nr:bifunctional enoyl-CoA hydratase/phosphate acetyltransferase [Planctomycetota bacterium]